jgi:asparagine synthase (glutamine-hydrolysing)
VCGIVGCLKRGAPVDKSTILSMRDSLAHRGPDDAGLWSSPSGDVALGSRRLAIQDLSPRGHQPMQDPPGRFTIVFNGEIYNWLELRKELESFHTFRSGTDTEVLLAAYARWGSNLLSRLNGMFAFAIWDEKQQKLFAARDRFGEKPFYYYHRPGLFLFGSEIKAILASGLVDCEPNLKAVYRFLAYRETDAGENTLYRGILSLPPAHSLVYSPMQGSCKTHEYWDLDPMEEIRYPDEPEYGERLLELLRDSVKLRLRSDVPVGSCLSGGMDSSTIVSLAAAQRQGDRQYTFSARFEDPTLDEGEYIRAVIEKFTTPNQTVYPDPYRMVEELNTFTWYQEHPFTAASFYSQWCVMRLAKEHGVTVLLDGQGGDELLGGYSQSAAPYYKDLFTDFHWSSLVRTVNTQFQQGGLRSLANILVPHLPLSARRMAGSFVEPLPLNKDFTRATFAPPTRIRCAFTSALNNELYQQLRCSMLPKLLRFADRSSMAFSREVRLPFLDHRVVEFLFAIPREQKINGNTTKYVLRKAMRGTLPHKVLDRTDKKGFETPQSAWLTGPLRPWAEGVLYSQAFSQRAWVDRRLVREIWRRFLAHPTRFHSQLLRLLSLEVWAQQFLKPPSAFVPVAEQVEFNGAALSANKTFVEARKPLASG